MKKMFNNKEVKRFRHREFIYYVGKKKPDWKSIIALNNLYFNIRARGKVIQFQPELPFLTGRCDAFFMAEYQGRKMKLMKSRFSTCSNSITTILLDAAFVPLGKSRRKRP